MPTSDASGERENAVAAVEAALNEIEPIVGELIGRIRDAGLLTSYAVIVGDDTSGRVPALIVHRIVNRARLAEGLAPIPLWFVPGSGGETEMGSAATRVLSSRAPGIAAAAAGGKALVVTDCVFQGTTVASIASGLRLVKVPCDVMTVMAHPWFYTRRPYMAPDTEVFVGVDRTARLRIDGDHSLSGVSKVPTPHALRDAATVVSVSAARRQGRAIADRICTDLGIA